MSTETTERPQYLSDWEGLTLEEVKANSQEIDTVRARCLGSLSAAMFYSFHALRSIEVYANHKLDHNEILELVEKERKNLTKIVQDMNAEYARINGEDLIQIPTW